MTSTPQPIHRTVSRSRVVTASYQVWVNTATSKTNDQAAQGGVLEQVVGQLRHRDDENQVEEQLHRSDRTLLDRSGRLVHGSAYG